MQFGPSFLSSRKTGFTLIELLVVLAIIAVLAIVVILTLNPVELFKQARDSNRLTDSASMKTALGVAVLDLGAAGMGSSSVIYLSLPDASATSTAGDQCQGLGLTAPPSGWSWHCASPTTYRNVDGTGWMPINFSSLSTGSPLSSLPVDPINSVSSGNYYFYVASSTGYAFAVPFESQKQKNTAAGDGGYDPARFETGTNLALIAKAEGLTGLWTFDEGAGSKLLDSSGNNASGTWVGTAGGANGTYYTTGKVGTYAGYFNGTDNQVAMSNATSAPTQQLFTAVTLMGWAQITSASLNTVIFGQTGLNYAIANTPGGNQFTFFIHDGSNKANVSNASSYFGAWHHFAGVFDGVSMFFYIDGNLVATKASSSFADTGSTFTGVFGVNDTGFWPGLVDDVRFYARPFSATEIKQIYNAEK